MTNAARLVLLVLACAPVAARAQGAPEPAPAEEDTYAPTIQLHGLVSQGFMYSTANNYLTRSSEGSFEFTEAALNVTAQVTHELRVGLQLFTRDLGNIGDYDIKFDWFYLDYRFADWLGLRAGRTKIPFGLYNEFADIDAAYLPILLPQSVYPTTNRDYLLAQTGAEVYGLVDLCDAGTIDYRLYGGTIFLEVARPAPGEPEIRELRVPYVIGGRVLWETPLTGLRVGATVQSLRLDADYILGTTQLGVSLDVTIWLVSLEYVYETFAFATEYGRWSATLTASDPTLVPDASVDNERFYVLVSNRFTSWLQLGLYYAAFFPEVDQRTGGHERYQHDVALSARFDVNAYLALKLEGHLMHGTAGLSTALNDGIALSELERDWGLFMMKATASF